jgi:5-oxoprolinase (ATP-hydrolysing)
MSHWEFWIDVGGTFTDCIARSPDGTLQSAKVLSSAVTKGRATATDGPRRFVDERRIGDAPAFWTGYRIRFLDPDGHAFAESTITDFDGSTGTLTLADDALPLTTHHSPLTPYELTSGEEAPILAIRTILGLRLDEPIPPVTVKLGTTRGTNALLERSGARTAFITTRGFADVLLIANQDRPRLFDLAIQKPEPLFERVVEIDERLDADGNVLRSPDEEIVRRQFAELRLTGMESIGICLLHSFANPAHEQLVEHIAREAGFTEISTSSRLSPLIKIVSRGDTTLMDAYLNPVLREYVGTIRASLKSSGITMDNAGFEFEIVREVLRTCWMPFSSGTEEWRAFLDDFAMRLEKSGISQSRAFFFRLTAEALATDLLKTSNSESTISCNDFCTQLERWWQVAEPYAEESNPTFGLPDSSLKIMTSSGGLVDAILSGPAGGVIGFSRVAERAGFAKSIGFDMGGTSTDVARFDGTYEMEYETKKAGVRVVSPMLAIETVAAGGGSVCGFDGVKLHVGPESAGADPGPACYGRGGPLTVTDVNLYLGKILPARFPFPLDRTAVEHRLGELCTQIAASPLGKHYTPTELAQGYVDIANANMVRAIRRISVAKGYNPADYTLVTFGGAGAQHACAMAESLGIRRILIHPFAGILSAYGIGQADVRRFGERAVLRPYSAETLSQLESVFSELERETIDAVRAEGVPDDCIDLPIRSLDLRYRGVESVITVSRPDDGNYARRYGELHQQLYGYVHAGRPLEIVAARVEVVARTPVPDEHAAELRVRRPEPTETVRVWFGGREHETGVFLRNDLHPGDELRGPAIVCEPTSTVVIDPGWAAIVREHGELVVRDRRSAAGSQRSEVGGRVSEAGDPDSHDSEYPVPGTQYSVLGTQYPERDANPLHDEEPPTDDGRRTTDNNPQSAIRNPQSADPVLLEIFNNLFASIAEQMGVTLQQTSVSTNVKERLDFSCAIFDPRGNLVVNAPHIPVHLGAMSETVKRIIADNPDMAPGDVYVTNDPYRGGSHLPDVTVITPVFEESHPQSAIRNSQSDPPLTNLLFFTASRAHHAEIGGIVPGSMPPFSTNLADEGVLIRNFKLVDRGESREAELETLLQSGPFPSRAVADNLSDVAAQVAANNAGVRQLRDLVTRYTLPVVQAYMVHIQRAASEKMRLALAVIPDGEYTLTDHLDAGQQICVKITIKGDRATVDFTDTSPAMLPPTHHSLLTTHSYNLNANRAIVTAAVLYVFRCLIAEDIPLNAGVLDPVEIVLPECLLNPPEHEDPAQCPAIVGGNVETSQRVVDTLLGALRVAAASQGTMNNLTFGDDTFGYYETICGGSGATPDADGADAVHTHMTNTRLTDVEVIERRYPVRIHRFAIRRGSGGVGVQVSACSDVRPPAEDRTTGSLKAELQRAGHRGGDGIVREIEFLKPLKVSMLSERRGPFATFGLNGGEPGQLGRNTLASRERERPEELGGKFAIEVQPGDVLTIETPGGGGFGFSSK